ncbi:MAG: hypothetical protein WB392_14560 [Methanotrichaceae archaeon]
MRYSIIVAFLISAILIGNAEGQTTSTQFIYKSDQKVMGEGFFSSYQNITTTPLLSAGTATGILSLNKRDYGSGSINDESTTIALNGANSDSSGESFAISERNISFKETVDMAYGEETFNLGKSFNSSPIRALGNEETSIRNYGTGASMDAFFDSTSALSKDLSANLDFKSIESGTRDDPIDDYSLEQNGITNLNVDATFTGKGHIGALVINGTNPKGTNHNANVATLIDEDYLGTYTLSKKISHEFNYQFTQEQDSGLDCCFGGWDTMNYYDAKTFGNSTKGVFDCTCYKLQKTAQFSEPDEKEVW